MALAKLADRIVVMAQRQVADEGSHVHLIELGGMLGGIYHAMFTRQANRYL
ncbi:hypothetical protein [Prochlorothrix hollandica]|uniref:hypothetical protein n=1 Tax=Prochlorothrix hollandica TaxID=1223 RepID=UPI00334018F3